MKNNKVTKPMKLLTYLKEERNFSQDKAEKLLKAGRVLVNDDVCTSPDLMLKKDDEVKIKKNKKLIAGAAIPLTALAVAGAIGGAASVIPVVNNALMVINVACADGTTWKDGSTTTVQVKVKKDSTLGDNLGSTLTQFEIAGENGKIAWIDSPNPDPQVSQDLYYDTKLEENQTIYATAGVEINYSAGEGRIVSGSTIEIARAGQTFGKINKPTVAGPSDDYVFDGWYDEHHQIVSDRTVITSNLSVTAEYYSEITGDKWIIRFTNDGDQDLHLVGNTVVAIGKGEELYTVNKPYPYKEGYKFVGWLYKDSGGNWQSISEEAKINSDMLIKPDMALAAQTKVATFHSNDGVLIQGSQEVNFEVGIMFGELPTPTFEKSGCVFKWWGDSAGNKIPSDTVLNDNIDVYACWTQVVALTATFVADEETLPDGATVTWDGPTEIAYEEGATFGGINKPHPTVVTTTGATYEVDDYYLNDSTEPLTPTTELPTDASCTITVTFVEVTNRHILTYYANQGQFDPSETTSIEFTDNTTFGNYYQPTPTREGYVFAGWYTAQEGGTQFLTTTPLTASTLSAYAHWVEATVAKTLTFIKTAVNMTDEPLPLEAVLEGPTSFGFEDTVAWTSVTHPIPWYFDVADITQVYDFHHFESSTDGSTWVEVTDAVTFSEDTQIRPVFEVSTTHITIEYDANGGTFDGSSTVEYKNVQIGSTFGTLIKPTPTYVGHIFTGWYDEDGNKITDDHAFNASTTIYAHWEAEPVFKTMTFSNHGDASIVIRGTQTTFQPGGTGVSFGSMTVPLAEKVGYEFEGWYIESSSEYDPDTPVTWDTVFTEDATVYPKFKDPYVKANRYFYKDVTNEWWVYDSETLCTSNPSTSIVRRKLSDPTVTSTASRSTFNEEIYIGSDLYSIAPNFLYGCTAFDSKINFTTDCDIHFIGSGFMSGCTAFNQEIDMSNCANLQYIYEDFLKGCTTFNKAIAFSDATVEVAKGFLYGCTSFNTAFELNNVKILGPQFLMDCINFNKNLTLPADMESIGEFFMNNCDGFTTGTLTIEIPANKINTVFQGYDGTFSTINDDAPVVGGFRVQCTDEIFDVLTERFPNLVGAGDPGFWRTLVNIG